MKYKLINIGRNQVSREVEIDDPNQLLDEVGRYLISRNISLLPDDDGESFRVYAGVRRVGAVERMES